MLSNATMKPSTRAWVALTILALSPPLVQADAVPVFRVAAAGTNPAATGLSWAQAFNSLQEGIDAAFQAGGGEVWVKAGVYKPVDTGRTATFELKPGVRLYGGFRGEETACAERNPKANRTILNGDIGSPGNESDNCYHVLTGATDTRVDGFIITRGNAVGLKQNGVGGGITIPAGTRKMFIANCTFEKNIAGWQGGAIYGERIELTATNCAFFSNAAAGGGGIAVRGASRLTLADNVFSANTGQRAGGAISLEDETSADITNCRFTFNTSGGDGGAIFMSVIEKTDVALNLLQCTFNGNKAAGTGGAVILAGAFSPVVQDCGFIRNMGFEGTGGLALQNGVQALVQDCSFKQNRGEPDRPDLFHDDLSHAFHNMEDLQAALKPVEESDEPQPLRKLADVQVYSPQHEQTALQSIVAHKPYTLLVLGDLTDPVFIENYRNIEAIASDFKGLNVQCFYIYRALTHPENNGYLRPYIHQERARQVQQAQNLLMTDQTWLYDCMDNQTLNALTDGNDESVFIYSSDGGEWFRGSLVDAQSIRSALAQLVGQPSTKAEPGRFHSPRIPAKDLGKPDLLDRVHFNPDSETFSPLRITPQASRTPFYAKLRAEGDRNLLETGNGRLYIGFHVDPLYRMKWDNSADPLEYEIQSPVGLVGPSTGEAPEIRIQAHDIEPREFVLNARQLDLSKPLQLRVRYTVYSTDLDKSIEVTQLYAIHIEKDPYGGKVFRRQIAHTDPPRRDRTPVPAALRHLDGNRDGRLSRAELTGNLWSRFPDMDTNRDGYLSEEEYTSYLNTR